MKKFSLFLVVFLVIICNFSGFVYAENNVSGEVTEVTMMENSALEKALEIFDLVTVLALPICAICLVIGAVQYFIMGIRNLYKKKQGLLLMFSSMTFYVIIVAINFGLTYALFSDMNEVIGTVGSAVAELETVEVEESLMTKILNAVDYATAWALPFCAVLVVFGAVQYFIMGIRNLYKKRQGLLLMFGSMAFYLIIVIVNFVLSRIN